jgi:hypothetical protein
MRQVVVRSRGATFDNPTADLGAEAEGEIGAPVSIRSVLQAESLEWKRVAPA